jgi:hypothetical protein
MESSTEEKIFSLMSHAEDLQKLAEEKLQGIEKSVSEAITASLRDEIARTSRKFQNELRDAISAQKTAAEEISRLANRAEAVLQLEKRGLLIRGVQQCSFALILVAFLWLGGNIWMKSKENKLVSIDTQTQKQEATLKQMHEKTWGIELVTTENGTRGIVLRKGMHYVRTGEDSTNRPGQEILVVE